jgi:hypothetical protein
MLSRFFDWLCIAAACGVMTDSYGTLIRRALGRKTASLLSAVTLIYLWGSSVAYLVRH